MASWTATHPAPSCWSWRRPTLAEPSPRGRATKRSPLCTPISGSSQNNADAVVIREPSNVGNPRTEAEKSGDRSRPVTPDAIDRSHRATSPTKDTHVLIDPMRPEMRPLQISVASEWPAALTAAPPSCRPAVNSGNRPVKRRRSRLRGPSLVPPLHELDHVHFGFGARAASFDRRLTPVVPDDVQSDVPSLHRKYPYLFDPIRSGEVLARRLFSQSGWPANAFECQLCLVGAIVSQRNG